MSEINTNYDVQPEITPKKPGKKNLIIAIIAAVAVIGIIIGVLFATGTIGGKQDNGSTPPPAAPADPAKVVADGFVQAIIDDDASKALGYIAPFLTGNDAESMISMLIIQFNSLGDITFESAETKNYSEAEVQELYDAMSNYFSIEDEITGAKEFTVTIASGGNSMQWHLTVIEQNGKWLLADMQF